MRLIDADAIPWTDLNGDNPNSDLKVLITFADKVNRMPTIEQPHWIPCSERLPEENQICIVTDETMKNTYEYRFCKETYDEIQGWTYMRHRIIAWMPLPEPYEEGKE